MIEQKEIKINIPEGYEIDKENSTFECVKFKPVKKYLTLLDIHEKVSPILPDTEYNRPVAPDRHKKVVAYASLSDIAEYYNQHYNLLKVGKYVPKYYIFYDKVNSIYDVESDANISKGVIYFENSADAYAVIENPNFREILDTLFK